MKSLNWVVVAIVYTFFATCASAQTNITWTSGYPKTGAVNKSIAVAGSITLDTGWKIKDKGVTIRFVPKGGGVLITQGLDLMGGTTIPETSITTMPALTAGGQYTVEMQITVTDPNNNDKVIVTSPGTATAKTIGGS
jgi:hypothetical protein